MLSMIMVMIMIHTRMKVMTVMLLMMLLMQINGTKKSLNVKRFLRDKLSLLRLYRKLKILTRETCNRSCLTN